MSLLVFGFFQTSLPLQSRFVTPTAPWRKAVCNSGFKQKQESQELCSKGCAAQRGRDAGGSGHTPWACIRFLRLFFCARWEHPNIPHNYTRVKPHVSACKPLCAIFIEAPSVLAFRCENEREPFMGRCPKWDWNRTVKIRMFACITVVWSVPCRRFWGRLSVLFEPFLKILFIAVGYGFVKG